MKALKKVPSDKKGLGKLPTEVRNKMGYMEDGGKVKPKKKKLVSKAGEDAYNRNRKQGYKKGTVSDEANKIAAERAEYSAKKNASKAYDDIMNFVGDRKYEKGGKVFKAHNMYKDGKVVKAKSMADHLRLKKQGYTHKK
jgi:hypothetical protein